MKPSLQVALAASALTLLFIYILPKLSSPIAPIQSEEPIQEKKGSSSSRPIKKITLITRPETTDKLMAKGGNAGSDIETISSLLRLYQQAFQGNPTGENEEITAALTGRNSKGIAVVPRTHRAINSHGELIDRWNTPYFFHALSGRHMEIRSAGPDRKFYTDDDILGSL
jgi:hypothetical protein